jgi:hypothetical protein
MIFIDGIGVGNRDSESNPFAALPSSIFTDFLDEPRGETIRGGLALRADASLGVEGLPQSATGQTALLTGVNAPEAIGRHLHGYPSERLREILGESSILKTLADAGRSAAFINVFNPLFFEAVEQGISFPSSATTEANMAASLPFFKIEDLVERRAVYQDFTNGLLIENGLDVPAFAPREAGEILAHSATAYEFCLYEYFRTDAVGHSQDVDRAIEEVRKVDEFLLGVLDKADLSETSILIASDHGNLEDLSSSKHTRNPVPVLLWGALANEASAHDSIDSILDVVPMILKHLDVSVA